MKVLRMGHACYLLTSKEGKRYLIDPFLSLNPGCPEEYTKPEFLRTIDAVFITHGHFDHTQGLEEVENANPDVLIVAQYDFGMILLQKGYSNVHLLNYGGSIYLDDVKVTMVQAMHTSSYGETVGTPIYGGQPAGYIFNFHGDRTLYHSGDTTMMADMKIIQDFYKPSVAILSASGQFVMGPEEAAYVVKHLLDVEYVIPNHQFPNSNTTPRPEVLEGMVQQFPVIETMMNKDEKLLHLLEDDDKTEVIILNYGEEKEFPILQEASVYK
ncbi:metal-dependent hydrolase [Siminovitchia sp. FSL H7-0308]|uniref:metal-dependent hydrolase n=1 Tax=Siminovitchia sp. FSL H7-0308 TaxID=2921432 RepID=UPI0030ED162A